MKRRLARIAKRPSAALKRATNMWGRKYCPVCERKLRRFYPFGNPVRRHAQCPHCGSLERHRLDWLFFNERTDLFEDDPISFLHIAPEKFLEERLRTLPHLEYLSGDIREGAAMVKMDITAIDFPDHSFSAIYCSHVLEHVPNDKQAISELFRVLRPGGWAVIQVPIDAEKTFEDSSVTTPEDRLKIFGQKNHVRRCGRDYVERIVAGGFSADVVKATDLGSEEQLRYIGVQPERLIFYCRKPID